MDLATVAYELYGLPPGEFVSVRDARAAQAKAAGDRELAQAVKQLRRPTTGAWLANLLVRERREQVTELLDLGDDMRRAQHDLAGDDLRRLSQRRRQLVSVLGEEAWVIAAEHGHQMNESSLHEVEATLEAAVADGAAGEALLSGSLTVALSYSGFGSVDLTGVVAAPAARPSRSPRPQRTSRAQAEEARPVADRRRQKRIEEAEEQLGASRARVVAGGRAVAEADDHLSTAQQERARLEEHMSDLENQLRRLRGDLEHAKRAERDARKARDLADRELRKLQDRLTEVTGELGSLRSTGQ
ncbi:MAG: hypothetical protein ACLP6E_13610 [Acidimicrobiales bacterium]